MGEKTKLFQKTTDCHGGPPDCFSSILTLSRLSFKSQGKRFVDAAGTIYCSPTGMTITFPARESHVMSINPLTGQHTLLMQRTLEDQLHADIYWGLLKPENAPYVGLMTVYSFWKPWLLKLGNYRPPTDPPHITLNYLRELDFVYNEEFSPLFGTDRQIHAGVIYVGPQGVAAAVFLTEEQQQWFSVKDSLPHISLALHHNYEARCLGPMVRQLQLANDWEDIVDTDGYIHAILKYSHSIQSCKIPSDTTNYVTLA